MPNLSSYVNIHVRIYHFWKQVLHDHTFANQSHWWSFLCNPPSLLGTPAPHAWPPWSCLRGLACICTVALRMGRLGSAATHWLWGSDDQGIFVQTKVPIFPFSSQFHIVKLSGARCWPKLSPSEDAKSPRGLVKVPSLLPQTTFFCRLSLHPAVSLHNQIQTLSSNS